MPPSIDLTGPLGSFAVLDIETAPIADAVAIAQKGGTQVRPILHGLRAFSLMTANEDYQGDWSTFQMTSIANDIEEEVLAALDDRIASDDAGIRLLVSYNGRMHDLPTIRRRMAANWMFDATGIRCLLELPHVDLMTMPHAGRSDGRASLTDACAAYGVAVDHRLGAGMRDAKPATIRKSQTDVAATFIVLLYEVALARRDERPLIRGWDAFARFLAESCVRAPHLEQFRSHPQLREALRAIAQSDTITQ